MNWVAASITKLGVKILIPARTIKYHNVDSYFSTRLSLRIVKKCIQYRMLCHPHLEHLYVQHKKSGFGRTASHRYFHLDLHVPCLFQAALTFCTLSGLNQSGRIIVQKWRWCVCEPKIYFKKNHVQNRRPKCQNFCINGRAPNQIKSWSPVNTTRRPLGQVHASGEVDPSGAVLS